MLSLEAENAALPWPESGVVDVVVDRLIRGTESPERRLDSIETAFAKGLSRCRILSDAGDWTFYDGWRCARCGRDHSAPDPRLFRYNSPLGACPTCEGYGSVNEPRRQAVGQDARSAAPSRAPAELHEPCPDLPRALPAPPRGRWRSRSGGWTSPHYRP